MKNLKMLRIKKGATITEVAEYVGITKQRYYQIEHGKSIGASNEALWRRIADFYGMDVFELLGSNVLHFKPLNDKEKKSIKEHVLD